MKRIYYLLLITSSLISYDLIGQAYDDYDFLDINNVKIPIFSRGDLFRSGLNGSYKAQIPKNTNTNTIFVQDVWFGGKDQYQELRIAGQGHLKNGISEIDFAIGPVSTSTTPEHASKYNHVWKISKSEIEQHIANFNSPGYHIPDDILTWPAHGDTEHGEASHLAPFVDVNNNGTYEPQLGDYPKIRGDQALFVIFNDARHEHNSSHGQKIFAEVHVMLYGYNAPYNDFLDNSFFVHYEFYNRSSNYYFNDFYISQFLDFDLGFYFDDYIGTHVTKNIAYVYNGDHIDESSYGNFGYGENPPAFGWVLLNQNYTSTMAHRYDPANKTGLPQTAAEMHLANQGLFKDGTPMYHGYPDGYIGTETTKFIYSGSSDPNFSENWTEITDGNSPTARQMLASTTVHDFGPGDKFCLDYAGVFSRDNTSDIQYQLEHLFSDVDGVQSVYNFENFDCTEHLLTVQTNEHKALNIEFNNQELTITRLNKTNKTYAFQLVNTLGQIVSKATLEPNADFKTINLHHLTPGVYFIPQYNFKFVKH